MQMVKLPVEVDPFKAAKRKLDFQGILEPKQMPRLKESAHNVNQKVDVWLSFDTDPLGLVVIQGKASTEVELECQRCTGVLNFPINVEFTYSPVCSEAQMDSIPEGYEAIELDDNNIFNLHRLIEDELLVALPLIAMHDFESCDVKVEEQSFGVIEEVEEPSRPNPFAKLASLKKKD